MGWVYMVTLTVLGSIEIEEADLLWGDGEFGSDMFAF